MIEKIKSYFEHFKASLSTDDMMKQTQMTSEMFWCGMITKENAIENLWRAYDRAGRFRTPEQQLKIANKIRHIESGRW